MRKWLFCLVVAAVVGLTLTPVDASSNKLKTRVMSQNLYIGADLERLLAGESPADILATVQQTDFAERADKIAETIDRKDPDLVGLQEVSSIVLFDLAGNVLLQDDYLDILLTALDEQGASYAVGSSVTNADVTLPVNLDAGVFARVVDRDVIIYRTETTSVSNPESANFETNFAVELDGFPIEFTRGYTAVDARVGGTDFRFVNTHLEVEGAPCLTGTVLVVCQNVQADELASALAGETLPTVLVGDFNAKPGDTAYETVIDAGYIDTWTISGRRDEPGYTCCQTETLLNPESRLDQRIDHIFVSDRRLVKIKAGAEVVGDSSEERTPSGLWYSDHGGVLAKIGLESANP